MTSAPLPHRVLLARRLPLAMAALLLTACIGPSDTLARRGVDAAPGSTQEWIAASSAFDAPSRRLFVVDAASGRVEVMALASDSAPRRVGHIDGTAFSAGARQVATAAGLVAVRLGGRDPARGGMVALYRSRDLLLLGAVPVGPETRWLGFAGEGEGLLFEDAAGRRVMNIGEPSSPGTGRNERPAVAGPERHAASSVR